MRTNGYTALPPVRPPGGGQRAARTREAARGQPQTHSDLASGSRWARLPSHSLGAAHCIGGHYSAGKGQAVKARVAFGPPLPQPVAASSGALPQGMGLEKTGGET